jgi:hypothetical protein
MNNHTENQVVHIMLQLRGRIVTLGAVQDAHNDAGLHERRNSNRDMRLSPATLVLFTLLHAAAAAAYARHPNYFSCCGMVSISARLLVLQLSDHRRCVNPKQKPLLQIVPHCARALFSI